MKKNGHHKELNSQSCHSIISQPPSATPATDKCVVPAQIMLDQHAKGSGSSAKGSDGVSWESLEKYKVILLKRKCNGGSDLVKVQLINTTCVLKCLQNKNHKNAAHIQHRERLWISDYESSLRSGWTSQSHCCRKYSTFCSTKSTHVNEWALRVVVSIKIVFCFPKQLCLRLKTKWQ